MKRHRHAVWHAAAIFAWIAALATACSVSDEKIATWKKTKKGPEKLAALVADTDQETAWRAKALVALTDIKKYDVVKTTLSKLNHKDADDLVAAAIPLLRPRLDGPDPAAITQDQILAKDALYVLYDFAGDASRKKIVDAMVVWCTQGDINVRAKAGFTLFAIAKKLGPPIARALIPHLTADQAAIVPLARLVRDTADDPVRSEASAFLAKQLRDNVGKFSENHLTAAAIIGGAPIASVLVQLATDPKLNAELQRFALRAYSVGVEGKNITPTDAHLTALHQAARDAQFDRYHREELYLTISQFTSLKQSARQALWPLLDDRDFFWRLVGLRCLLRLDGEALVSEALQRPVARTKDETQQIVDLVAKFPPLRDKLAHIATQGPPAAAATAILALGKMGDKASIPALQQAAARREKLPKRFAHATVGRAAAHALSWLDEKG